MKRPGTRGSGVRSAVLPFASLLLSHCVDATPERHDAGLVDSVDAGQADATILDGGDSGTKSSDAASAPEGHVDAALLDGGRDTSVPACANTLPLWTTPPERLSETALYADLATKQVADSMLFFEPQFALWSDGADKSRWMYLPECDGIIMTTDMDHWSFPVGARAFKEFAVDGKRIETRFVHRYGPGQDDFLFGHYLWNDDESEALLISEATDPAALINPKGTAYTVPTPDLCVRCHGQSGGQGGGQPSRFLGFSAIQLSHDGPGETMHSLSAARRLSRPNRDGYSVPGTPEQRAALGYLHANCAHCHNESDDGVLFPGFPLSFHLETTLKSVYETRTYLTAVGVEVTGYDSTCTHRVYPGDPGLAEPPVGPVLSCAYERMGLRDAPKQQMPPLATNLAHPEGLALLKAFVQSLAPAP